MPACGSVDGWQWQAGDAGLASRRWREQSGLGAGCRIGCGNVGCALRRGVQAVCGELGEALNSGVWKHSDRATLHFSQAAQRGGQVPGGTQRGDEQGNEEAAPWSRPVPSTKRRVLKKRDSVWLPLLIRGERELRKPWPRFSAILSRPLPTPPRSGTRAYSHHLALGAHQPGVAARAPSGVWLWQSHRSGGGHLYPGQTTQCSLVEAHVVGNRSLTLFRLPQSRPLAKDTLLFLYSAKLRNALSFV